MAARPMRRAVTYPQTVAAPVGGLNARDSLAAMPPTDAVEMENYFPDTSSVLTRKGHEQFADGTALYNNAGALDYTEGFGKLATYNNAQTNELFAVISGYDLGAPNVRKWHIYKVNTNGTFTSAYTVVGLSAASAVGDTGCGEDVMFVPASGTAYLIMLFGDSNGIFVVSYDGTNWALPSITGLPSTRALGVHSHQKRLWFYGNGLNAYYLPFASIAGAVATLNLGLYFTRGGRIVSMRTWTIDGAEGGTDDIAVFLTDQGQAAAFAGTDPSSAATWQLIGTFDVGRAASPIPIVATFVANRGSSYMIKYGADLAMVLSDGVATASRVLKPNLGQQDYTISGKINQLIRDAAAAYGQDGTAPVNGWAITHHPKLKQLILNIPTVNAAAQSASARCTSFQYVMNTETQAWTKFTGMSYLDAVVWRGDLYMVAGGYYVYRYGTVALDPGSAAITCEARQAFTYLDNPNQKHVTLGRPVLRADGNLSAAFRCGTDFTSDEQYVDRAYTPASSTVIQQWWSPNKYARAVSAELRITTSAGRGEWIGTDWVAEPSQGGL